MAGKIISKVKTASTREIPYQKWILRHLPNNKELEKQRKTQFEYQPKISIVVPLYKTPEKYLRQLVETVKAQTYTNWELCLSDGSGENSPIEKLLENLAASDKRIKVISHNENASPDLGEYKRRNRSLQQEIILHLQTMTTSLLPMRFSSV